MKRKITAAIAVFFTTISIASSVFAHDGTVNFTGKIIEAGCKIDGSVTTDKDVELGEISRTVFTTSGDTAATTYSAAKHLIPICISFDTDKK